MSQQLQITGGAKVRDLNDVIIGTSGVLSSLAFNVANGVPKLDSNAKILVSQLPNSVMEYLGTWNAATNTPFLVNGTGNAGDVYLCNVAGTVDFGAGPISFVVSDQVIYSGSIWQKASGSNGTVTSIGLTSTGNDAITITGSPITTSGNINLGFAGTNLQYINGAGDLTTFPTLISSIGLSMPSAFSVANSPLTSNGTIAVTGAGYPSQYIRGDGTLADFPTSGGGGSSVSYYLNGGTSQGTIGGVTYYEMSKTADTGTMADFSLTGNGFIVAFLTDAGDPAQLNIPAGNWNYEIYASMSANGGTPEMYAELYKYDGTTFTLIATSPHEILYDGTALNLYTFAMTVPSTTLAITDRLAVKLYATNSGGKTTTVHTQDSHLCQIITTFSTGITALNGLTAQVQYFATGTSGTDFNISSTTATHTFNIPSASATNRGLITTGSQTIAGDKAFTGINSFDYGINYKTGASLANVSGYISQAYATSGTGAGSTLSLKISDGNSVKAINLDFVGSPATYTYTFPAASGTISLLESTQTFTGINTFSSASRNESGILLKNGFTTYSNSYTSLGGNIGNLIISGSISGTPFDNELAFTPSTSNTYTFPNATGTLALTSNLSSYVPYTGATTNVNLGGFGLTASSLNVTNTSTLDGNILLKKAGIAVTTSTYVSQFAASSGVGIGYSDGTGGANFILQTAAIYDYTFPAASGTIALTSNLSAYLPLVGGTLTGALGGTYATFSSIVTTGVLQVTASTAAASASTGYVDYGGTGIRLFSVGTSGSTKGTFTFFARGADNSSITPLSISNTGDVTLTGALSGTSATFSVNQNSTITNSFINTNTTNNSSRTILNVTAGNATLQIQAIHSDNIYITPSTATDTYLGYNNILRLLANGNATFSGSVAIGSSSAPSYTLDVSGTGRFTSTLLVSGAATFSSTITAVRGTMNGTDGDYAFFINGGATAGSSYGLRINAGGNSSDYAIRTKNAAQSSDLFVVRGDGNVGIGTTSPSQLLDVRSSSASAFIQMSGGTSSQAGLNFQRAGADKYQWVLNSDDSLNAYNYTTSNISLKISNAGRTQITGSTTDSSEYVFDARSSTPSTLFFIRNDGAIYTGVASASPYNSSQTGRTAILASGGLLGYLVSTRESKANIESIKNVDFINQLNPVKFNYRKKDDQTNTFTDEVEDNITYGFIADEIEKVNKDLVFYEEDGITLAGVEYNSMIAILTKAIQEQQSIITSLQDRLDKAGL